MIEGLKLDFTSVQLNEHLSAKRSYHAGRAVFYAEQATKLEAGGAEGMQYTGGDPVRALREKGNEHTRKAALFSLYVAHVIPDDVYRLSESDLERLEMVSRFF